MSTHPDDDLGAALRQMLADPRLDVRPRGNAVQTVLAGVGRARRRRTAGYAAVSTFAVAAAIGAITLTGGDSPQGIDPVVPPSAIATTTSEPTATPSTSPSEFPTATDPETPQTNTPAVTLQNLSPTGIGDVHLGMTVQAAYATGTLLMLDQAAGEFVEWDGSGAENVCVGAGQARRSTPDLAFVWMDDAVGVTEIAVWATTGNPEVQTVDGLRFGDDFERVPELYPDARFDDSSPNSNFYFVDDWDGSGNLLKIRDDQTGTVRGMSVVLPNLGGCYE